MGLAGSLGSVRVCPLPENTQKGQHDPGGRGLCRDRELVRLGSGPVWKARVHRPRERSRAEAGPKGESAAERGAESGSPPAPGCGRREVL